MEASLLQDQPFSAAASVYISVKRSMAGRLRTFSSIGLLGTLGPGDRRLCMKLELVSLHTNLQLHYYSTI